MKGNVDSHGEEKGGIVCDAVESTAAFLGEEQRKPITSYNWGRASYVHQ